MKQTFEEMMEEVSPRRPTSPMTWPGARPSPPLTRASAATGPRLR